MQLLHPSDNGTFSQADVYDDVYGYQFLGYSPGKLRATYYIVSDRQPAYNTATVTVAAPVTGEKAAVASDAIVTGVTRTGESEEIVNHGVYVRRLTWFIDANGNGQLDENEECTPENGLTADGKFLGGKTYSVYFELAVTEGMGRLNNEAFTLKVNDLEVPINTTAAQGVYTFPETEIVGYGVSGNVESFNSDTDPVTIQLIEQGQSEAAYEVQVSGGTQSGNKFTAPYAFSDVPSGTYTMKVMKKNHVTREYTVTVGSADVTQNVKIHLKGDIDGNGTVTTMDVIRANSHARGVTLLTDYALKCADVVGTDGTVTTIDVIRINAHAKGTSKLW